MKAGKGSGEGRTPESKVSQCDKFNMNLALDFFFRTKLGQRRGKVAGCVY